MDVPRHSNINLANHQGILEELWIFKFDGFYLSSVKASLPGCWCCLWKGRVEMEFNTSLEVYCLEGNWEYLQSRMKSYHKWDSWLHVDQTLFAFLSVLSFWLSVLNFELNMRKNTHLKISRKVERSSCFSSCYVLTNDSVNWVGAWSFWRHIHSAIPFLTEVCCSLGWLRSLESLGSFRTTFTTDDNVPYGSSSDFFSALRCGRKFNDCKDLNERHDIPWTHKTFTSATGRFCQEMFPVASWTYLQKMSLFYPPNFRGVHSSRQFIESNPHPPPSSFSLEIL